MLSLAAVVFLAFLDTSSTFYKNAFAQSLSVARHMFKVQSAEKMFVSQISWMRYFQFLHSKKIISFLILWFWNTTKFISHCIQPRLEYNDFVWKYFYSNSGLVQTKSKRDVNTRLLKYFFCFITALYVLYVVLNDKFCLCS